MHQAFDSQVDVPLSPAILSTNLVPTSRVLQELKSHLVFYKKADLGLPFGMELYTELPPIRDRLVNSLKGKS